VPEGTARVRGHPGLPLDLRALQADAQAEGRRCVVGALILDESGRVFVHRRSFERRLLPGCWDIVGGHVEAGETLLEALERELGEETGWGLTGTPTLAYVADWETSGSDGAVVQRREFDFVVTPDGDLTRPRLERPKHVEFRWLGVGELDVLAENRGLDGGMVHELVKLALDYYGEPGQLTHPHLTAFVEPRVAPLIELLRTCWDPATAAQISAHVTIAYPAEIASLVADDRRIADALAGVAPFRFTLGRVRCDNEAASWIFVQVDDLDRGWAALRERLLGRSHTSLARLHVTLVHPRTTNRGWAAWAALAGSRFDIAFTVSEIALTAFDGRVWRTVERFSLRS
jgi:8-oxo-dGTP diphosphatase